MLLVKQNTRGRAFLFQFEQIMYEFGSVIPWLFGADSLHFVTNSCYFNEKLHQVIGCPLGSIVPYQLLTSGRERLFVGSILRFTTSPERFTDPMCIEMQRIFDGAGAVYISCLQVRNVKRGLNHGTEILLRSVRRLLQEWPQVWGVCEPSMVPWYMSLGATIHHKGDNSDNLAIISWS